MFLQRCVPPNYKNIVLSHQDLVSSVQYLATYCADEEMHCKRAVETIKAEKPARSFREDKELLNIFDNKLVDILEFNAAYHRDFPTVKKLLYKLFSVTIGARLRHGLDDINIY